MRGSVFGASSADVDQLKKTQSNHTKNNKRSGTTNISINIMIASLKFSFNRLIASTYRARNIEFVG
jgi:hypothetical protein